MKIEIIDTSFHINKTNTFCTISYKTHVNSGRTCHSNKGTCTAVAHLKEGDKFDPSLGMKIAEAKAHRKLYLRWIKNNNELIKKFNKILIERVEFNKKAEKIIKDQTEDILRLAKD